MKQELVRIQSTDGIEQPGILYEPHNKTNKIIIHVHGLNGNFYENRFIDALSHAYTEKGYAFLTFSNRGRDFVAELLREEEFVPLGGCLERFKDCILDIEGVINWVVKKGYTEIILEGHSYGCNKVLYYYHHKKNTEISRIVLLGPCDVPAEWEAYMEKDEYERVLWNCTKLVKENKEKELIDFPLVVNGKVSAGTCHDFMQGGESDFIRYRTSEPSIILQSIDIPSLIIFGDKDDCVLTSPIKKVKEYLTSNLKKCNIQIIPEADHLFTNKLEELRQVIIENMEE